MADKFNITFIIGLVIAGLLLSILIPIAFNDLLGFHSDNATVQTLVGTVLPVIAVIAIAMLSIPKTSK